MNNGLTVIVGVQVIDGDRCRHGAAVSRRVVVDDPVFVVDDFVFVVDVSIGDEFDETGRHDARFAFIVGVVPNRMTQNSANI